jgi:biotin carboxyl carrier protein
MKVREGAPAAAAEPAPPGNEAVLPYREVRAGAEGPPALVVRGGRVLPAEWQDVPSEREGKLLFLATETAPGEEVAPKDRVPFDFLVVAVRVPSWDGVPAEDRVADPANPRSFYRRALPGDELPPGATVIVRQRRLLRRIDVGERVRRGQLLGVINPALAEDDLALKLSKVEAAAADAAGAAAMADESRFKLDRMRPLLKNRAVPADEYGAARASKVHYEQEEVSKRAAVKQAQRELSASLTTLRMHLIRASMTGTVCSVHKQNGEAVKNNDAVLRIQGSARLRVEATVEEQDALPLRERLEGAHVLSAQAAQLRLRGGPGAAGEAQRLEGEARGLLRVWVEAGRVARPAAALTGHLQAVRCVAVTRDTPPRLVTGGDDQTVRVWAQAPGGDRWQEVGQFNHRAAVRAVACSRAGPGRLLTTTADGRARLFDLDHLADPAGQRVLQTRHAGAVLAAAFSPDGTRCATGGEDHSVCLYDSATGERLARAPAAHGGAVTSLAFTARNQLVSAGRDRRLVVWDLGEGGKALNQAGAFDSRSGEVDSLGVDPAGERTLFDDGRDLRVLSLRDRKIVGTLRDASTTATFTTTAQFSPDGRTVLTSSTAGGLRLWRAPAEGVRPAELLQYASDGGPVACAAFSPDGKLVVAGTQDHRVLVWPTPPAPQADRPIEGELSYVEDSLDTSLKRVAVRATFDNPGWVIPGSSTTLVAPQPAGRR